MCVCGCLVVVVVGAVEVLMCQCVEGKGEKGLECVMKKKEELWM